MNEAKRVQLTRSCHAATLRGLKFWAVSSAVEHCLHTAVATGSIPVPPTTSSSIRSKNGRYARRLSAFLFALSSMQENFRLFCLRYPLYKKAFGFFCLRYPQGSKLCEPNPCPGP